MSYEKLKRLSKLHDEKVKLIVDDNREIIGTPFNTTETDDGEDAYQIIKTGGKDFNDYGDMPYFTEEEIVSIEVLEE